MRGSKTVDFAVVPTELRHAEGIYDVVRLANGYPTDRYCHCINAQSVAEQLERFPQGQFVAVTYEDGREKVVGMGTTMLTRRSPGEATLPWYRMIGSFGLRNHDPEGDWLYGVELAVHPDYQRQGIGSALYAARLGLIDELGLKGWYAGGMLMGYYDHREELTPVEYAHAVIRGDIHDPTVSMQLKNGLKPRGVIEEYYPEWKAGHAAVLLVYEGEAGSRAKRSARPRVGLRSGDGLKPRAPGIAALGRTR